MIRVAMEAPVQERKVLEDRLAQAPAVRHLHEGIPTGVFPLNDARRGGDLQQANAARDVKKLNDAAGNAEKGALPETLLTMARERGENAALALRRNSPVNEAQQGWFDNARSAAAAPPAKAKTAQLPDAPKEKGVQNGARQLEYPYQPGPHEFADTRLWHPTLFLENGAAVVRFDIAPGQATTYRVLLLGHGPTGRFGFFETRLDVPAYSGR